MSAILVPVVVLGGIGLIFGAGLGFASKVFAVETDPKVDAIREVLPGANCGACGYPGCDGCAAAIASDPIDSMLLGINMIIPWYCAG